MILQVSALFLLYICSEIYLNLSDLVADGRQRHPQLQGAPEGDLHDPVVASRLSAGERLLRHDRPIVGRKCRKAGSLPEQAHRTRLLGWIQVR